MKKLTALALALSASVSLSANAGIVTNDTELLSAAGHQQFSQWLGQDVDLTRIFAKQEGDTGVEWHDAVDNQGPTLSLIEIFNGSDRMIIGGYTNLNWSKYQYASNSVDGDGNFLMNLSRSKIYRKNSNHHGAIYSASPNNIFGPTFGGGHDFHVEQNLSDGYANIGYGYGERSRYTDSDYREGFTGTYNSWTVGKLETFTLSSSTGDFGSGATARIDEQGNAISATNVSAPFSLATLGLAGMFLLRRRITKKDNIDTDFV